MDWLRLCRNLFFKYPLHLRVLNHVKYNHLNISCLLRYRCIYSSIKMSNLISDYQHLKLTSKQIRNRFPKFSSVNCNPHYISFSDSLVTEERKTLVNDMVVIENFLNEDEETSLLNEVEPYMKRLRYEFAHWDDVGIIS